MADESTALRGNMNVLSSHFTFEVNLTTHIDYDDMGKPEITFISPKTHLEEKEAYMQGKKFPAIGNRIHAINIDVSATFDRPVIIASYKFDTERNVVGFMQFVLQFPEAKYNVKVLGLHSNDPATFPFYEKLESYKAKIARNGFYMEKGDTSPLLLNVIFSPTN